MQFHKVEYFLSAPRIARFLAATGGDQQLAFQLYLDSLRLAQAFHPVLGLLEVSLRNALNEQLTIHFNDPDWIIHQKQGFMRHQSLRYRNRRGQLTNRTHLLDKVMQAENTIRNSGKTPTAGRIISEVTLGFWTSLFERKQYRVLRGQPIQIFSGLPSGIGRADIANDLTSIRTFRNRMSHNQPICFSGNRYDCQAAGAVHQKVKEILSWLDSEILTWLAPVDDVVFMKIILLALAD